MLWSPSWSLLSEFLSVWSKGHGVWEFAFGSNSCKVSCWCYWRGGCDALWERLSAHKKQVKHLDDSSAVSSRLFKLMYLYSKLTLNKNASRNCPFSALQNLTRDVALQLSRNKKIWGEKFWIFLGKIEHFPFFLGKNVPQGKVSQA